MRHCVLVVCFCFWVVRMARYLVTKKIDTADLRIGMYVTALEVPWSATEFPLKGVLIKSTQDILKISRYGHLVTIDQNKAQTSNALKNIAKSILPSKSKGKRFQATAIWRKLCTEKYPIKMPIAKQLKPAEKLLTRIQVVFDELKQDLQKIELHNVEKIKVVSCKIVASLLENPDALLWLTKVKIQHGKIYDHIVRTAIWGTLMGRSMGLKQVSLNTLIEAILLSGIGKAYLPNRVWANYDPADIGANYAGSTYTTLEKISHCHIDQRVLSIIANINERYDGSGYPCQKLQDRIPYLAQIAGLVETFDLILHPMHSRKRRSFGQALSRLYCFRDGLFNTALIEEFIAATGLYPAGTIVVLSNGYRGVVVEQTKDRRIRATVALTHDAQDYRLLSYQIAKLGEGEFKDIMIREEANLHLINDDDMRKINGMVGKYQQGKLSSIFHSTKDFLSGN